MFLRPVSKFVGAIVCRTTKRLALCGVCSLFNMPSNTICRFQASSQPAQHYSYLMALGGMPCNSNLWTPDGMRKLRKVLMLKFHPDKTKDNSSATMFQMARKMMDLIQSHPFGAWPKDVLTKLGCCETCIAPVMSRDLTALRDDWKKLFEKAWEQLPSIKTRRQRRRDQRIVDSEHRVIRRW